MNEFKFYLFLAFLPFSSFPFFCLGQKYDNTSNKYFLKGETFKYEADFLFFSVGEATVSLSETIEYVNGNPCYKVEVLGKTVGIFTLAGKLKDTWCSYIDTATIIPHKFYRDLYENGYTCVETTDFDHVQGKAIVDQTVNGERKHKTYDIPLYVQDMVSGYYYLRTISLEDQRVGDTICVDAFLDDSVYGFSIRYLGKAVVKTRFGKIKAFVMSPIMPDNNIFDGGNSIKFWVSDDLNRIPLKVKARLFIGSIQLNLTSYNMLKEPFNKIE